MDNQLAVFIFGGADHGFVREYMETIPSLPTFGRLSIGEISPVEPDQLLAGLLTGMRADEHGVTGSKHYTNNRIRQLESVLPDIFENWRRKIYVNLLSFDCQWRRYVAEEIEAPTLFDYIESGKPVTVPAYNPEEQWAIYRNTIRVHEYPVLGETGARNLIEKNHLWRKHLVEDTINSDHDLFMAHFQYIDSYQHVFYQAENRPKKIEQAYTYVDNYADELLGMADEAGYDTVLLLSEHGRPLRDKKQEHRRTPFYACSKKVDLDNPTIWELHDFIRDQIVT